MTGVTQQPRSDEMTTTQTPLTGAPRTATEILARAKEGLAE